MSLQLDEFLKRMQEVCLRYDRDPASVKLIAVSKKQPLAKIHEAHRQGQLDFGENYVQEALEKQSALQFPDIRWHLIGPVQTNKINKILGAFALIHSVDSLKTAQDIDKRAAKLNKTQPILLQLNLSHELTKSGQSAEELRSNWKSYQELKHVDIQGLMTLPPLGNSKIYFEQLRDLARELGLKELSMGTTSDWEDAIACGATMIRVGTAVFGERNY